MFGLPNSNELLQHTKTSWSHIMIKKTKKYLLISATYLFDYIQHIIMLSLILSCSSIYPHSDFTVSTWTYSTFLEMTSHLWTLPAVDLLIALLTHEGWARAICESSICSLATCEAVLRRVREWFAVGCSSMSLAPSRQLCLSSFLLPSSLSLALALILPLENQTIIMTNNTSMLTHQVI